MTGDDRLISDAVLDPAMRVVPGTSVRVAASLMEDAGISCLLVGEGPPRIVTEHDLVGALAAGSGPESPIERVETREPAWVTPSTSAADAVAMMVGNGIRHLVVLHPSGEVAGVLTLLEASRLLLLSATAGGTTD